jgi:4'-phosphopantetheinyl transferase
VLTLSPSRVDLWYVRSSEPDTLDERAAPADPSLWQEYRDLLPPEERSREERFTHEPSRRQFLVARALARTVLAHYTGRDPRELRFECNAYGKPFLSPPAGTSSAGPSLEFNLSHTGGLVVCAVTSGNAVGVDVEDCGRRTDYLELAQRFFAASEAAVLAGLPPDQQRRLFFEFWTLKEAFIKARGMGLSIPLDGFAFSPPPDLPPRISFPKLAGEDSQAWQFARLSMGPRYQIAVALDRKAPPVLELFVRETRPLRHQTPGRLLPPSDLNTWSL